MKAQEIKQTNHHLCHYYIQKNMLKRQQNSIPGKDQPTPLELAGTSRGPKLHILQKKYRNDLLEKKTMEI